MAAEAFRYVIVGASLAGASAVKGIRQVDPDGSILLIGRETDLPYHRPPLTKTLWTGKKKVEDIFVNDAAFYAENGVVGRFGSEIVSLDAANHLLQDAQGNQLHYDRLLLATGGSPRHLDITGANTPGICYYRSLNDYQATREQVAAGKTAVVIGGGFIGSEIAAALTMNGVKVTMIFPDSYLVSRIFPWGLGATLLEDFRQRGITILPGETPSMIERAGERFLTRTRGDKQIESDLLLVGIGITPNIRLAQQAKLHVWDGVTVNEYLQTSDPDIFAAGDLVNFPYQALGKSLRVEHWDHALHSGEYAGANMAGAQQVYDYMPYFFSDLFDFGYEAVGEVNSKMETLTDWQEVNSTGVIYYLDGGVVRGAMMCNIFGKVEIARELIRRQATADQLPGAILPDRKEAA